MSNLYRGPYIDAFCQVWFHLIQLFQRSSLKYEKLTDEMEPNLAGSIYVRSSIKLLHLVPFDQQTWPLLLKIEHTVKLHVFGNNSKTVNNKNCPWWPYLLAEWDEKKKLYRGPYIDAFCQVWFQASM
jgi:hypothetical protein